MKRREDWPELLDAYLQSVREEPFRWDGINCATFAAGAVAAMTGEALSVPKVNSAEEFVRFIRDRGSFESLVIAALTDREALPSPAFAQRGDVVLLDLDGRDTLGVCIGAEAAAPGMDGMVTVPMSAARAAWSV